MPIVLLISKGSIPAPQVVTPAAVRTRAAEVGHANAAGALGITIPKISVDLTQEVLLANDLTVCEQRKWGAHERGHVDDNRTAMDSLEAEVRQYGFFQDVFVNGTWYPGTDFQLVQQTIMDDVGAAFRDLTDHAATAHDSIAEYRRVAREILRDCPAPITYVIQRGEVFSRRSDR